MSKTPPLKVAMITNRYLPIVGGAEMQANHLSCQLVKRGHSVNVITRRIQPDFPTKEIINGIPVQRLSPTGLGHRANALMFFRIFFFLLRHARQYDVFHVHSLGPVGLATLIAGKLTGTPTTLKIPSRNDITRKNKKSEVSSYTALLRKFILPQWLWRRILASAGAIIVLNNDIMLEAQTESVDKHARKIPNGVDISIFHPIDTPTKQSRREKLSILQDDFVALFSGRLIRGKRIEVLIEAMHQIVQDHPQAKLFVAGSGAHQHDSVEAMLRQLVIDLNLQERVIFLGHITNIVEYLQIADCYAFSSESEGMPNAILEAMACGLPIVASRIDSITEIINEDNAYLADVGNVDEFAKSIRQIIENPDEAQQKGDAVLKHVQENYSLEIVAEQYEALYRELLGR